MPIVCAVYFALAGDSLTYRLIFSVAGYALSYYVGMRSAWWFMAKYGLTPCEGPDCWGDPWFAAANVAAVAAVLLTLRPVVGTITAQPPGRGIALRDLLLCVAFYAVVVGLLRYVYEPRTAPRVLVWVANLSIVGLSATLVMLSRGWTARLVGALLLLIPRPLWAAATTEYDTLLYFIVVNASAWSCLLVVLWFVRRQGYRLQSGIAGG